MVDVFERRVDEAPWSDAVRSMDRGASSCVSLGQLDRIANAIAWHLIRRYSSRSEPVALAVCAPELMLACALGVLKAGKFYAAVNPLHPAPRVRSALEQLGARVVLCDRRCEPLAPPGSGVRWQEVEEIVASSAADGQSEERPGLRFEPGRLAYVLYTSGSTGQPRGVAQCRGDMLHNVARHRAFHVTPNDCVSLISADGFVSSISNPYVALLNGAALAPYSFRDAGAEGMMGWLRQARVTVLYAFPSFLRQLGAVAEQSEWDGLRLVYLGGEPVLPADLSAARRLFPAATLSTGLNSSETGLTCLHTIPPESELPDPVPVGRPAAEVEVAIVDEHGNPVPTGHVGEMEIRSEHVQPRYWDARRAVNAKSDRVAQRASDVAIYGGRGRKRAFRTGDRARVDGDGVVYHLGRLDSMVKVRGFRVELAEVEAAIAALDAVAEVAVLAADDGLEGVELVAYVVVRAMSAGAIERYPAGTGAASAGVCAIDAVTVRRAVARALPAAMIPAQVVVLDALPRTLNGKVDRRALARLRRPFDVRSRTQAAPSHDPSPVRLRHQASPKRGAVERQIAAIWAAVLGVEQVHPDEDFFALGGTSIAAVAVIARVRAELDARVPLAVLFQTPSVAGLTDAVLDEHGRMCADRHTGPSSTAVRVAREADLAGVCELVNHYIQSTTYNFRAEPQAPAEWIEQWAATRDRYPWLVASRGGRIVGVAYAGSWKQRSAYDWCAEVTAYVAADTQRAGVGRALYSRLLALLDKQGYRTQVALIALPNEPSVAFHEACGFELAGVLGRVGFKHDRWLDVGFWQRSTPKAGDSSPAPILDVSEAGGGER